MSHYLEFALPDGHKVIIESDEPSRPSAQDVVKASRGIADVTRQASETLEQAVENARQAALIVVNKMRSLHDSPDEVEVTFGLKASGELGTLVVAKAGVEASYSVKLTWKSRESSSNGSVSRSRL